MGRRSFGLTAALCGAAAAFTFTLAAPRAHAEPAACLSPDPTQWPQPAKPYFMILMDTSGSMTGAVGSTNSCGYPNTRIGHAKCALKNMFQAYGGQVNFGLMAFARGTTTGCTAYCGQYGGGSDNGDTGTCHWSSYTNGNIPQGGCGVEPTTQPYSADRRGGEVLVEMQRDNFYAPPLDPSNVSQLLTWVDNDCSQDGTLSHEIWAEGGTPLNGILRDAYRYLSTQWTRTTGSPTYSSPIADSGERACRSINAILITDGLESCDDPTNDPPNAAAALLSGFSKGGITWSVKTYVIDYNNSGNNNNAIAVAGGTGAAIAATNEATLSAALANIISKAIQPETCDNADNNCNGCTDEGFTHYCNTGQTCCSWSTAAQRATCMTTYQGTITAANPSGDLTKLPCATAAQQQDPTSWLCYNPKETCDGVDNNCQNGVDENVTKCGSPPHCPQTEICNKLDDDCDGQIDNGIVCNTVCIPSPEVCDGCDNDCDGTADNGAPSAACGLLTPSNCVGTATCKTAQTVATPGGCVANGGFNACQNNPQIEKCDGIDNNCNGVADDGIPPTACVPVGTPSGLVYGGTSQCKKGSQPCNGTCQGFVGPSPEVCDGIDNDCNGVVDDGPFGVGTPCGVNTPPCKTGLTACVNGALVCQGGVQPQPEICDGIDNNCNGQKDEAPLADAPAAGQNGCWTNAGNCCTFGNLTWCPPAGATCTGNGTLTTPCNKGKLVCKGAQKWACDNPQAPSAEVCDGVDNNCNGQVDDGSLPQVGQSCGSNVGECKTGTYACTAGVLDCPNDVEPKMETCNGKDDDCDGQIDNGIPSGGPCQPSYDTSKFPGDRSKGPCIPGEILCNGAAGFSCLNGVAPQAEVCDGIDNDCDGSVDETGPAPDGIDGSADPNDPSKKIGGACGLSVGECKPGTYACVSGVFSCLGEVTATPEVCDCNDNDCDGQNDNTNAGIPLCSTGKDCVKAPNGTCSCAQKCKAGSEYPCPPGQQCQAVTDSNTGAMLGNYCVPNLCDACDQKTIKDKSGNIICAPKGAPADANCVAPPVCVCKGQAGCKNPCDGVTCQNGQVCTDYGPNAGKCVADNCYNVPCVGCNKACHLGSCVDNPCKADSCPADKICKPSGDFTTFSCIGSCADKVCPSGQVCQNGDCVPGCNPACGDGQYCDLSQSPPTCVEDKCGNTGCAGGGCCNPVTGACGDCPCEGIDCPTDTVCMDGQCVSPTTSSSSSSSSGSGGGGGGSGGSGGGSVKEDKGVYGLATGGGGCACEAGPGASRSSAGALALLGLSLIAFRRRRAAGRKEVVR